MDKEIHGGRCRRIMQGEITVPWKLLSLQFNPASGAMMAEVLAPWRWEPNTLTIENGGRVLKLADGEKVLVTSLSHNPDPKQEWKWDAPFSIEAGDQIVVMVDGKTIIGEVLTSESQRLPEPVGDLAEYSAFQWRERKQPNA